MPSIPEEPEVLENEPERRTMPDFVKPLADVEVIEGKEAILKCKVSGLPYPTIAWYHNGKRIESSEERKMTQRKRAAGARTKRRPSSEAVNKRFTCVLQTGMCTVWSFGALAMLTGASTRQ